MTQRYRESPRWSMYKEHVHSYQCLGIPRGRHVCIKAPNLLNSSEIERCIHHLTSTLRGRFCQQSRPPLCDNHRGNSRRGRQQSILMLAEISPRRIIGKDQR